MLPDGLRALGCTVDVVPAYRTVSGGDGAETLRAALERGEVDLVTFASASAVRGYVDAVGPALARRVPAVSIGPVTSEAIRGAGMSVAAESTTASIDALAAAVVTSLRGAS